MRGLTSAAVLAVVLAAGTTTAAYAQLAVSANDAKVKLVNGKVEVVKSPPPDTVSFIDLRASPPKVLAEIDVPNSVVGPPSNVAISPKEEIVLVAAAQAGRPGRPHQDDPRRQAHRHRHLAAQARLSSKSSISKGPAPAPKVIATLQAGKGAAGVAINKAGTLALVANRAEGTVSVFTIGRHDRHRRGQGDRRWREVRPKRDRFHPGRQERARHPRCRQQDRGALDRGHQGRGLPSASFPPACAPTASTSLPRARWRWWPTSAWAAATPTPSASSTSRPIPRAWWLPTPLARRLRASSISTDGKYVAVTVMNGTNKPSDSPFFNESGNEEDLDVHWHPARQGGRASHRQVVPGHCLVLQQPHPAGAMHGGGGDHGRALLRTYGPLAAEGRHHQDQGRARRHPHCRALIAE